MLPELRDLRKASSSESEAIQTALTSENKKQ